MSTAVIIPARAGSVSIPHKNLCDVGGMSLVRRCALTCMDAGVGPVYVSSDSYVIAAEGGVGVIERPPDISGSAATSESAIVHALQQPELEGVQIAVMVQCTAPFTRADDVRRCVEAVEAGAGSAFAACRFHGFLWGGEAAAAHGVGHDASMQRQRRQDSGPRWLEAGSVYAFRVDGFLRRQNRFVAPVHVVEVPAAHVFEIDDPWQLETARLIFAQHA